MKRMGVMRVSRQDLRSVGALEMEQAVLIGFNARLSDVWFDAQLLQVSNLEPRQPFASHSRAPPGRSQSSRHRIPNTTSVQKYQAT